ncbi:MAG: hypothetical protein IBX41_05110 [Methanophagales archaeon]|nr:hypothetical protein [Methanophagales archaeon]
MVEKRVVEISPGKEAVQQIEEALKPGLGAEYGMIGSRIIGIKLKV